MFALKCLCCEHDNRIGEEFCEQCGSTLNLKLCEHCQAINKSSAQRCHKCDAKFPAQPAVDQFVSAQTALGPEVRITDAPSAAEPVPASRAVLSAWLLAAMLLAAIAGLAYYIYRHPTLGLNAVDINRGSPGEADRRGTTVPGVAVTAGAEGADAENAKGATSAVPTHTKPGTAATIAPTPGVRHKAAATSGMRAPDASTAEPPTLTLTGEATPSAPPADSAQQAVERPRDEPRVNVRQEQPSAGVCTEAVAALGLCSRGSKQDRN